MNTRRVRTMKGVLSGLSWVFRQLQADTISVARANAITTALGELSRLLKEGTSDRMLPLALAVETAIKQDNNEPLPSELRFLAKRMSTRLRFRILARDGFRCRYCGKTSGEKELHVDHVTPLSKGGTNDPANLVTACSECNMGKTDTMININAVA